MAIDAKAVITMGYWYTTASELTVRIASWGWIGIVTAPVISAFRKAKGWVSLRARHKLR